MSDFGKSDAERPWIVGRNQQSQNNMSQINLSWPANPASEAITSYSIVQSKDGGPFNPLGTSPTPSFSIANPGPGVYAWKVKATNLVGTGPESAVANGPTLPSAPGEITVVVS